MSRKTVLIAALGGIVAAINVANATDHRIDCASPAELTQLSRPLKRVAGRLSQNESVTILAIGSSSTEGYGASSAEFTYPSRLAVELKTLLPNANVRVLNRGVGGEDAREMIARMEREIAAAKPDLVLWQVGTNALLHEQGVGPQAGLIRVGLRRIHDSGADAVLIDPQYAPKVLRDPDAQPMVSLLARVADEAGIPVFRRFALMQFWHEQRDISFAEILSPDLFHMNDWSYGCFAANLAGALAKASLPVASETDKTAVRVPAMPESGIATPISTRR
jgi:lysophospholipase L1-like esterase